MAEHTPCARAPPFQAPLATSRGFGGARSTPTKETDLLQPLDTVLLLGRGDARPGGCFRVSDRLDKENRVSGGFGCERFVG
jgi:hypothetical protein